MFRALTLFSLFTVLLYGVDSNATLKSEVIDTILKIQNDSNETIVDSLELGEIIESVNSNPTIQKINGYLSYIYTDIGKLILFFLIILFSFLLQNIGRMIFPFLKKIFKTTHDNLDDVEVEDFEPLKSPLAFLIKVFGVNLAFDVLFHPSDIPFMIEIALYIAYLIGFVRLLVVLIDIFFYVYYTSNYKKKNRAFRKELVNLIKQIIKFIIITVGILLLLRKSGVDITGFLASLGLGGLVIAMASKDTISNFFGSLKIIFDESFSQGDWIKVAGVEGTVVELGFISTKIRTFDNALISVPNAKLANESVKNWNRRKVGRRIKMKIGISYNAKRDNLLKAVNEIREMLINHPDIATDDKVGVVGHRSSLIKSSDLMGVKSTLLVHVDSFEESAINILIYAFSKTTNWATWLEVKEDVMMKIWEILEKHGLEMAFPTQTIHIEKGDK